MTRTLDPDVVTEITKRRLRPRLFVKFEFDSGDLRLVNDWVPRTFDGEEYTPSGDLGAISAITEQLELNANGIELMLSAVGVPNDVSSEWISIALQENVQGRPVTVWDAFIDDNGDVVGGDAGPIPHVYTCDVPRIVDGGPEPRIMLTAESVLRRLEVGSPGTFRTQWQRKILGGIVDVGFNQISQTRQSEVFWGREREL